MSVVTKTESKALKTVSKLFPVGAHVIFDLKDRHVCEISGYCIELDGCIKLRLDEGRFIVSPSICRTIDWN